MPRKLYFGMLLSFLGVGFFLLAGPAWAVNTIPVTCTSSTGCNTDPAFPNTWFTPGLPPGSDTTTTLTFPGQTFTTVGIFNVLDQPGEGPVSDQLQLVHAVGGDKIIITPDPASPLPGGTTFATENAVSGGVGSFPVQIVSGGPYPTGYTLTFGSDAETIDFNPIGIGGGQPISDFVQLTPEPSTMALLASGLVGLGFMRRTKKLRIS